MRLGWLLLAGLLFACAGEEAPAPESGAAPREWEALWAAGPVDTVGVAEIAEGDTTSDTSGLTIIETTVRFPAAAEGGEAFAWEFYARELHPVKLIVVRYHDLPERTQFELIGESETVVPRQRGINRFALREPIPLKQGDMYGIVMPEAEAVPFKTVRNWKALITIRPLTRPLIQRDYFASYGWRYAVRVFFRPGPEGK